MYTAPYLGFSLIMFYYFSFMYDVKVTPHEVPNILYLLEGKSYITLIPPPLLSSYLVVD